MMMMMIIIIINKQNEKLRDWDEKLEVVHGEPNHHRGEWEVKETSHASAQRESGTLVSAPKEAFRTTKQLDQQITSY